MKAFKSILEFQKHFNTEEKCREFLEEQRWGKEAACPFCGSLNVGRFATNNRIFKCREKVCRKKFSVTVGTIYENTKIPLAKWFLATYILSVHSKGISSLQLASWLDVTQKTAWFLNHRIREMLTEQSPELLNDICEVDETYIGGSESNKHFSKRKLVTKVIPQTTAENVQKIILETIEPNSIMVSDEHHAYKKLNKVYKHESVNHREKEYVRGIFHTNTIEGYWNILKKQIDGIHHSVSPKHLQRYCNESAYRYNNRQLPQDERFALTVSNCEGRLKYDTLINKNAK